MNMARMRTSSALCDNNAVKYFWKSYEYTAWFSYHIKGRINWPLTVCKTLFQRSQRVGEPAVLFAVPINFRMALGGRVSQPLRHAPSIDLSDAAGGTMRSECDRPYPKSY